MAEIPVNLFHPDKVPWGWIEIGGKKYACIIDHKWFRILEQLQRRVGGTSNSSLAVIAELGAPARALLGLTIGEDVQAWDADLDAIAALAKTDSNFIVGNGTTWVVESGATVRTSLGLGTGDTPQFTGVEVGHASDTTITRLGAGDIAVEGNAIYRAGGTDVPVADGGSGRSDATAYAVICGGTTSTGAHQSIAGVGTSGQVLTSNGAGALPSFQDATGGEGGAGYDEGDEFPASPGDQDKFYRNDLNLLCYYVSASSHWRTVQQYWVQFEPFTNLSNVAASATVAARYVGMPPSKTYDFWMETFIWSSRVVTTNNGTNYWRFDLDKQDSAESSSNIVQPKTDADTANLRHIHETSVGAVLESTDLALIVTLTKVLSPGNCSSVAPKLVGRLIIP